MMPRKRDGLCSPSLDSLQPSMSEGSSIHSIVRAFCKDGVAGRYSLGCVDIWHRSSPVFVGAVSFFASTTQRLAVLTDAAGEKVLCLGLAREYSISITMTTMEEPKLLSACKRLPTG